MFSKAGEKSNATDCVLCNMPQTLWSCTSDSCARVLQLTNLSYFCKGSMFAKTTILDHFPLLLTWASLFGREGGRKGNFWHKSYLFINHWTPTPSKNGLMPTPGIANLCVCVLTKELYCVWLFCVWSHITCLTFYFLKGCLLKKYNIVRKHADEFISAQDGCRLFI